MQVDFNQPARRPLGQQVAATPVASSIVIKTLTDMQANLAGAIDGILAQYPDSTG